MTTKSRNVIQIGDSNEVNGGINQRGISAISGSNTTIISNLTLNYNLITQVEQSSFQNTSSTSQKLSSIHEGNKATTITNGFSSTEFEHIEKIVAKCNQAVKIGIGDDKPSIDLTETTSRTSSQHFESLSSFSSIDYATTSKTLSSVVTTTTTFDNSLSTNVPNRNQTMVESFEAAEIVNEEGYNELTGTKSNQSSAKLITVTSTDYSAIAILDKLFNTKELEHIQPIAKNGDEKINIELPGTVSNQNLENSEILTNFPNQTILSTKVEDKTKPLFDNTRDIKRAQHTKTVNSFKPERNNINDELFEAVKIGNENSIRKYIESKGDANTKNVEGNTLIEIAAEHGQLPIVKYLTPKVANILTKTPSDDTLLHIAAAHGDIECVKHFLQAGINKDDVNDEGRTPLHVSAWNGHLIVVKYLVEIGGNALASCNEGRTALHYASYNGNGDCVRWILSNTKLEINRKEKANGFAPIHIAAKEGHLNIIKILLENGADIKQKAYLSTRKIHGNILQFAAFYGHLECVEYLIGSGRFYVKQNHGTQFMFDTIDGQKYQLTEYCNPIHDAAEGGQLNCIEYLVARGADIYEQTETQASSLYYASKSGSEECVNYFISKGININLCDIGGKSPIHAASKNGHLNILKLLYSKGARMFLRNALKRTALHYAASGGHLECISYLLNFGFDVNAKDSFNETPIFLATKKGHSTSIFHLIASGANILETNKDGETLLHVAMTTANVNEDVVKCFIHGGLQINACTKSKLTPLYQAAYYGHTHIFNILIDSGADYSIQNTCWAETPLFAAIKQNNSELMTFLISYYDINAEDHVGETLLNCAARGGFNDGITFLLDSGAFIFAENIDGETAFDIAQNNNNQESIEILNNYLSKLFP